MALLGVTTMGALVLPLSQLSRRGGRDGVARSLSLESLVPALLVVEPSLRRRLAAGRLHDPVGVQVALLQRHAVHDDMQAKV